MGSWDARDLPLWDSFCFWKKNIQTWRKRENLTIKHGINVLNISLPVLYTQFMQLFCRLVPSPPPWAPALPHAHCSGVSFRACAVRLFDCSVQYPGVTRRMHDGRGGPTYFYGLKIYTLGIIHVFV